MTVAQQLETYRSTSDQMNIPHHFFTLENGLRVLVIEDHTVPLVEVSVQYNVGSKDEPKGLKGFAHLFEHLMFCGTNNHPGSYITNLLKAGAVDINGYTTQDETFYYQTVPISALDYTLFAESERMGYFEESLTQDMLDQQIGIVVNEKDERESQPFGQLYDYFQQSTLPEGHPYQHPIIGYKEDIYAANLEKAKAWFRTYYRPSNAILTLAGDIDFETAESKVNQFFGQIDGGKPPEQKVVSVPYLHGEVRGVFYDKTPDPHLYFIWKLPAKNHETTLITSVLVPLLSGSKMAFLNRILVEEKALAKNITVNLDTKKLCSQILLSITPAQDISLQQLEDELKVLLQRFLIEEITQSNLQRIQLKKRAEFIFNIERLSYRSLLLRDGLAHYDDRHAYSKRLDLIKNLHVDQVKSVFKRVFVENIGIFQILPYSLTQKNHKDDVARVLPQIGTDPRIHSPKILRKKLENGLELIWVERNNSAVIDFVVDYAFGTRALQDKQHGWISLINKLKGLANSGDLEYIKFNQEFEKVGASYGLSSRHNSTQAYLKATQESFGELLPLFYDYLFNTPFSLEKFEQEKKKLLAELSKPFSTSEEFVSYVYNALIYPPEHPLSESPHENGTVQSIEKIKFEDVLKYHQENHLVKVKRLLIVGGQLEDQIFPLLNQYFGHLAYAEYPSSELPIVPVYKKSKVYLIQDDSATQDNISLSTVMSSELDNNDPAYKVFRECFSHSFNGRVNLNLREQKTWTYGVNGFGATVEKTTNYGLSVGVEQQYTLDAIKEILAEFHKILTVNPLTEEEHQYALRALDLKLTPQVSNNYKINQHILWLAHYNHPDNWIEQQQEKYRTQQLSDTLQFIKDHFKDKHWIWVIRGNVIKIKEEIEALGIGEVEVLNITRDGYYS